MVRIAEPHLRTTVDGSCRRARRPAGSTAAVGSGGGTRARRRVGTATRRPLPVGHLLRLRRNPGRHRRRPRAVAPGRGGGRRSRRPGPGLRPGGRRLRPAGGVPVRPPRAGDGGRRPPSGRAVRPGSRARRGGHSLLRSARVASGGGGGDGADAFGSAAGDQRRSQGPHPRAPLPGRPRPGRRREGAGRAGGGRHRPGRRCRTPVVRATAAPGHVERHRCGRGGRRARRRLLPRRRHR